MRKERFHLKSKVATGHRIQSGDNSGIGPYLRDATLILPLGTLQSFQMMAGTVVVHQLPAALGNTILPTEKHKHEEKDTVTDTLLNCQNTFLVHSSWRSK